MGIIATDKRTLSGYLVGIGKRRADGSEDFQFIKPVKNMIVKQGLNNWLRYNGGNTLLAPAAQYASEIWKWPAKNIDYCLFGLSNAANDFETTTELAQLPNINPYSTKKTSWPYCGSRPFDNNGKFIIRISHISPAVTNDYAVKEIGYYTRFTDNTNHLFSRVALPFTYNLYAGEQLITTYELVINFPYSYSVSPAIQTTLKDANGVDLEAVSKLAIGVRSRILLTFPYIKEDGSYYTSWDAFNAAGNTCCMVAPIFTSVTSPRTSLWYSSSIKDFPANEQADSALASDESASRPIPVVSNYTLDSFQRDIVVSCPTFWPNMTSADQYTDIYYLNFLGFALKFGHTVDGVFTPTPWRKYANHTARFVYRQAIATAESIAWLQNQ